MVGAAGIVVAVAVAVGIGGMTAPAFAADPTALPDAKLAACINADLRRAPETPITPGELAFVTGIFCEGVESLDGLEHAVRIQRLMLRAGAANCFSRARSTSPLSRSP